MRNILLAVIAIFSATIVSAQQLAPSPNSIPTASPDIENLRQQLQALTETVKTLQQQVKDQQAAIDKTNGSAPSSSPDPEASPLAAATPPSPAATATATQFAT